MRCATTRGTSPGVSNLLEILAVVNDTEPATMAERYSQYGPLKADAAAAIIELLAPIQARFAELAADPGALAVLLAKGADAARSVAAPTLDRAQQAVGLR